jgi:hypothetical protein
MAKPISQLIWLGAGTARCPVTLPYEAEQVLLVEARQEACTALGKQFADMPEVRVKQCVISEKGGEVTFNQYNLPEFSALHPATGLSELFPGLKLLKTPASKSETIVSLLGQAALGANNNALIIDIADIALSILNQLQQADLLQNFNQLWLQAGDTALYQGSATQAELSAFLQQNGFMVVTEESSDPDFPWLKFSLNPLWQTLQQTKQQNVTLNALLETAKQQVASEKQQAEQAKIEFNKQSDSAKQQYLTQKQQAEQITAELSKQLEAVKQRAASEKQQAEQMKTELGNQLEAAKKQAGQVEGQLNKQLLAEKQLQAEKQQAEQACTALNNQLEQLTQQISTKFSENETLQQQLRDAKLAAEKMRSDFSDVISGKDVEHSALIKQRDQARDHVNNLTAQHKELSGKAEKLQLELSHSAANLAQAEQQYDKHYAALQAELEVAAKHASARLEKINQLEKTNRQLHETNAQLQKRQSALEHEMLKAHAQIDIVKELLLR